MMMRLMLFSLFFALALNLQAFPPVEEGMTRHVLDLGPGDTPEGSKVEIIVGDTITTDGVNYYHFDGRLEEKRDSGRGTHLVLPELGMLSVTLLPVPPDKKKEEAFVRAGDQGAPFVLYRTGLPIVVDVPEGCEVRYRIWTPSEKIEPVPEG